MSDDRRVRAIFVSKRPAPCDMVAEAVVGIEGTILKPDSYLPFYTAAAIRPFPSGANYYRSAIALPPTFPVTKWLLANRGRTEKNRSEPDAECATGAVELAHSVIRPLVSCVQHSCSSPRLRNLPAAGLRRASSKSLVVHESPTHVAWPRALMRTAYRHACGARAVYANIPSRSLPNGLLPAGYCVGGAPDVPTSRCGGSSRASSLVFLVRCGLGYHRYRAASSPPFAA